MNLSNPQELDLLTLVLDCWQSGNVTVRSPPKNTTKYDCNIINPKKDALNRKHYQ